MQGDMSTKIANIVLTDVRQFTYKKMMQFQTSEKLADACADTVIKVIALNFKNRIMYIPTGITIKKVKIHSAIRTDFDGHNHAKLAIKYRQSLQNIYKILKAKNVEQSKRPITIEVIEDYVPIELINLGLSKQQAELLAKKIAVHLQQTFPGISICPIHSSNGQ